MQWNQIWFQQIEEEKVFILSNALQTVYITQIRGEMLTIVRIC